PSRHGLPRHQRRGAARAAGFARLRAPCPRQCGGAVQTGTQARFRRHQGHGARRAKPRTPRRADPGGARPLKRGSSREPRLAAPTILLGGLNWRAAVAAPQPWLDPSPAALGKPTGTPPTPFAEELTCVLLFRSPCLDECRACPQGPVTAAAPAGWLLPWRSWRWARAAIRGTRPRRSRRRRPPRRLWPCANPLRAKSSNGTSTPAASTPLRRWKFARASPAISPR